MNSLCHEILVLGTTGEWGIQVCFISSSGCSEGFGNVMSCDLSSTNMCAAHLNGSTVSVEEVRQAFLPCPRHSLILISVEVGAVGSAPYRACNLFAYCKLLRGIWLPPRVRKTTVKGF